VTVVAARPPSRGLGAQIRELVAEARDAFPGAPAPATDERAELEGITRTALAVLGDPAAGEPGRRRALAHGVQAQDLLHALHEHRRGHRDAMLSEVQQGLRRLGQISSSAALLDRVCQQAVRSCALERVMLSRVDGDVWRPWMLDFSDDRDIEQQMIEAMRDSPIALDESPIERTILAQRRPAIVGNVRPDHAYAPILGISRSTSYVVVPVAPAGRVVGLLHADHGPEGPRVDLVDRDVLWTFAEGFGRIYERTELHERLRAQRERVQDAFEVVETTIAAADATEIELGDPAGEDLPRGDELWTDAFENRSVDELLTAREREVLALMVRGQNNAAIAERLVIREGTVKSHVKHILRKLGAVNRTEAISRYLSS
jgi:DNA-binding CsgD family transcriptional regulator